MRRSLSFLVALVALAVIGTFARPAAAYPFMVRHGFAKCGSCHVDPMGGETLTGFGRATSETLLSTRWGEGDGPTGFSELLFGIDEPEWLRLGGSYRHMTIFQDGDVDTFPMQADVYGAIYAGKFRAAGSVGISRVPQGSPHARAAQITSNTDGERPLNLVSRTHWLGYEVDDGILARAGRINLPFGIRMPEHVMWVREGTRTDRDSDQQHGVSVAYSRGRIRGELMAILGNFQISPDRYRERGYSLNGEYLISPTFGVGVSSLITRAESDRLLLTQDPYTRHAHGLTARFVPFHDLVLLGEMDLLLSTESSAGYVGMLQVDYEPIQGLHLVGTGEVLDNGKLEGIDAIPGAGEARLGGWLSAWWFIAPHFDARVDFVARQESKSSIQVQGHFYF